MKTLKYSENENIEIFTNLWYDEKENAEIKGCAPLRAPPFVTFLSRKVRKNNISQTT